MSVAAINPESTLDRSVCTARLIPGQRAVNPAHRKSPHALNLDGSLRTLPRESSSATRSADLASLILPAPFASNARLWPAVTADCALILVSWIAGNIADAYIRETVFGHTSRLVLAPALWLQAAGNGLLFAVIATLLGYSEGLYLRARERTQLSVLVKALGWTTILSAFINYLHGSSAFSLTSLASSSAVCLAALAGRRAWCERQHAKAVPKHTHNVLIVGANRAGRDVALYLEQHPELGRVVRGFLDDSATHACGVLGGVADIAVIARAHFVDEVILAAPHRPELPQIVIREARKHHLDVRAIADVCECQPSRQWMEPLGPVSLVTLHEEQLPTIQLALKRLLDMVLSAWGLLCTAPAFLVIACLIKLDSPGPLLYSAPRVGRKGKQFRCHKFRTMITNAAETKERLRSRNQREGPCFKIDHDPRITPLGRWLRRFSLDELPQLWNVLRGEMSLVGPRPHPLDDFARYELGHLRRLDVTPGITGLWQVTARRSPSFHTNLALDLEYIERWSLWMDFQILLKTIAVVFQGTGE